MKSLYKIPYTITLTLLMLMGTALSLSAQTDQSKGNQTLSFKVYGVCDDCKERIESTAMDGKGVKKAEWDKQSNVLVLVGTQKMDKMKVAKAISKTGYKTEFAEADKKAFAKLPACCQYEEGVEKH